MTKKPPKVPKNYIAYQYLYDAISVEIEDVSRRIGKAAIHAPLFHDHTIDDLQSLKGFCDRAIEALNAAKRAGEGITFKDADNGNQPQQR